MGSTLSNRDPPKTFAAIIHSQISTTNLPASRHSLESTQTIQPPSTAKMSLKNDKFPSSAAFDAINSALNATDADRKDAIKQGNGIYAFTLKNSAGEESSWHIDLKETGKVGTGLGTKPNVTLSLSDADFGNLCPFRFPIGRALILRSLSLAAGRMHIDQPISEWLHWPRFELP